MNVTLTQLQYLTAVDSYRNFVKAAESCFVTQPTLSMQIQKLEEHLGVKLFDRSRLPVVPTQIGVEVIAQARIILNEAAKIEQIILDMKGEVKGEIRVGLIPTLGPYLAPLFAPQLIKAYPEVNITLVENTTKELVEMLRTEQIDCALMAGPVENESELYAKSLFFESFVAYTHENSSYYLMKRIKTEEINTRDLWLLNEGHCLRNQVINLCRDKGTAMSGRIEYDSGSLDSLIRMVDKNRGLTILPELAVRDLSEKRKEKVREFTGVIPSREIKLYTHRAFPKQILLNALVDSLNQVIPDSMKNKKERMVIKAFNKAI